MRVEVGDAVNHRLRLVRGGRVVKPHQLFAVHPFLQDGEVPAHRVDVKGRMARGVDLQVASGIALGGTLGLQEVERTGRLRPRTVGHRSGRRLRRHTRVVAQQRPQIVGTRQPEGLRTNAVFAQHAQGLATHAVVQRRGHQRGVLRQAVGGCRMWHQRRCGRSQVQHVLRRGGCHVGAGWRLAKGQGRGRLRLARHRAQRCAAGQHVGGGGHPPQGGRSGRARGPLGRLTRQGREEGAGQLRQGGNVGQAGRRRAFGHVICRCLDSHGTCQSQHRPEPPAHHPTAPPASSTG